MSRRAAQPLASLALAGLLAASACAHTSTLSTPDVDPPAPTTPPKVEPAPIVAAPAPPSKPPPKSILAPLPPSEVVVYRGEEEAVDARIFTGIESREETRLFDTLFPHWLIKPAACSAMGTVEEKVARGDIYPAVRNKVVGAFTVPRKTQSAYLIRLRECGSEGEWSFGTGMLALVDSDGTVAAKGLVEGWSGLKGVFDLDGNGLEEILFGHATTKPKKKEPVRISAKLLEFRKSTRDVGTLRDFGVVQTHDCTLLGDAGNAQPFAVVKAKLKPGRDPVFTVQTSVRGCL